MCFREFEIAKAIAVDKKAIQVKGIKMRELCA